MALATTLGMSSCGDDFLLLEPAGTASENALLSENGIDMALTAVYSSLNNMNQTGWMGYAALSNYCFGDVAGADANKGSQSSDQSDFTAIEVYSFSAANSYIQGKWAGVYEAVKRCNNVIDMVQKAGDKIANPDQIIAQANDQAAKIVADAQKQADSLLAAARKEAADNAENVQKELRLHAAQAVEALKSEIATVVTDKIVQDSVKGFTADQKSFNEFMLRIAQEWGKNQQIEIKAQDADALTRYFNANAKALLDKGVKITQVNGQPAEFSIQPADGSYKVNFGTDEFMNWFKSMLRPQLAQTLF